MGTLHSLLGALSVFLAFFQPLNAVLRCHEKSRHRGMFTWTHRVVGVTSFILAMAAMLIACLFFSSMFSSPQAAAAIWILYLAILISSLLVKFLIFIREWFASKDAPPDKIVFESDWAKKWKSVTLGVFLLSASLLSITLCIIIALKP